ncbi:hypothetical protein ANANG_G00198030 [Anguilla anguilla]|uniref:Uncharacterized protein n=1 Tax=Anguilla anguilla TaxID=7936 RepID=A0A9D3M2C6_ANGAN|nr:hypothetical protein ANANG_G00198030 [Anguilla anguilla]
MSQAQSLWHHSHFTGSRLQSQGDPAFGGTSQAQSHQGSQSPHSHSHILQLCRNCGQVRSGGGWVTSRSQSRSQDDAELGGASQAQSRQGRVKVSPRSRSQDGAELGGVPQAAVGPEAVLLGVGGGLGGDHGHALQGPAPVHAVQQDAVHARHRAAAVLALVVPDVLGGDAQRLQGGPHLRRLLVRLPAPAPPRPRPGGAGPAGRAPWRGGTPRAAATRTPSSAPRCSGRRAAAAGCRG